MTTLENRPNTALLVVDVQVGVVAEAHDRDAVVANIGRARRRPARRVPVVWIQQTDDDLVRDGDPWQIVPELRPDEGEHRIEKAYGDSFEDTPLEAVLAEHAVGRVVVVGAQTDECIRSTLHGAITRGYDTVLVEDAHTTEDLSEWGAPTPDLVIAHTNLYWTHHAAPGRTAGTVDRRRRRLRRARLAPRATLRYRKQEHLPASLSGGQAGDAPAAAYARRASHRGRR